MIKRVITRFDRTASGPRHAFAWMPGASLRDLQDAMGHASPRTTRRYDRSHGNLDRSPGHIARAR